mmetsp:Transcript_12899/g.32921  ORF Transcript_12899/g.32921 Transcript_12899/m.32921 type:complete len:130 (-) Transcript_12899:75-464(-)|eukprot:CAMPEP_0174229454 /NCGR_PEP_ID=MMETSP0417-20130205/435_1 /TAXON_ID=242541 /ORGANISM="Mayorella sp, Strain BSH-02190019" /LENGTH=129 /DNA_ID=CAMNT_0015307001 /DNA_START=39 /DNA_END=428 /DNA_ORIENTATION=+
MNFIKTLLALSALLAVAVAVCPHFPNTSQKDIGCDACTYVIKWAESEIPANATISDIENVLDKACGILPKGVLRDECNHIMNKEIHKIAQDIYNKLSPDQICKDIDLCKDSDFTAREVFRALARTLEGV